MIRAVITRGAIVPCDPLPEDWQEGTEVAVERASGAVVSDNEKNSTDTWMDEVEALVLAGSLEDVEHPYGCLVKFGAVRKNWFEGDSDWHHERIFA